MELINKGLRELHLTSKFYHFNQNNSGGYFDVDDNVCEHVFIEAYSEDEAIEKLKPMIENQSASCDCCGDRWSLWGHEIDLDSYKEKGYNVSIYTHYKDYEDRWFKAYGQFKRLSDPTVVKQSWGSEFVAPLYFESVEEYAQFRVNRESMWGLASRKNVGAKIHYLNGTRLDLFKTYGV
jgi:hypothetical protein